MLRKFSLAILLVMVSSMIAACGGQPAAAPTAAPAAPTEAAAAPTEAMAATEAPTEAMAEPTAEPTEAMAEPTAEAPAASGALNAAGLAGISQELDDALAGKLKGTTVTMTGPFVDADAVKFADAMKSFEEATGITIQYAGSKEFEASIKIAVDGGNPPDIVDFPQPGLLATFVKTGKVVDASQFISADWLKKNYNQSWLDMAQIEGPSGPITAGVWQRVNAKSLIWYPKKAFDEAGYTIPTTWDEMLALSDQIVADGDSPWCIGIESGAATGWAATDWMEEIMLRTTSLENYDKWVTGELKFDSPEVKNAAQVMSDLWFKDNYVLGGRASIVTTNFGDAPKPMFDNPPGCWLHHQGNFITSFFPETAKAGVDYDFFYMPPIDPQYGKPVLVAGDLMAAFNDRPEVRAVLSFFSSGLSVENWIKSGGAISPQADSSLDWYTNEVDRGVAKIILDASSVRFDASDLMPGQVGAGSFWSGMTAYVAGTITLDEAMKEIDAAWPQ
ncbi:ABC transporter substrate-binding protein [Oscillochloris sp. ZM17-4]|uniref:ABC transporter substrate-binding protein n=1 Tax=Oscillochloris sp. ZM17-4 TaxID=2866714 RepID=UPI001C734238|nr:ABC transporter substrate-binding protein [Oscillochloris sp. ZM17-4]MBX0330961.1 ABC transporter substrate-binding protein [Oscillochloris sp. ZM17-4]